MTITYITNKRNRFSHISGTYYSNISANTTVTLPPIIMVSTLSFDTFTIGEICYINIAKANSDFTHTVTYCWGDTSESGLINNKGYKEVIAHRTNESVISWIPEEIRHRCYRTCISA